MIDFNHLSEEDLDKIEALSEKGILSPEQVMAAVGLPGWTFFDFKPMQVEEFVQFAGILGKENFLLLNLEVMPDGRGTGTLVVSPQAVKNASEALASGF